MAWCELVHCLECVRVLVLRSTKGSMLVQHIDTIDICSDDSFVEYVLLLHVHAKAVTMQWM